MLCPLFTRCVAVQLVAAAVVVITLTSPQAKCHLAAALTGGREEPKWPFADAPYPADLHQTVHKNVKSSIEMILRTMDRRGSRETLSIDFPSYRSSFRPTRFQFSVFVICCSNKRALLYLGMFSLPQAANTSQEIRSCKHYFCFELCTFWLNFCTEDF